MISFLCYLCHVIGDEDLGVGKVQHDVVAGGVHVSCDTVAYVILGGGFGAGHELVSLN